MSQLDRIFMYLKAAVVIVPIFLRLPQKLWQAVAYRHIYLQRFYINIKGISIAYKWMPVWLSIALYLRERAGESVEKVYHRYINNNFFILAKTHVEARTNQNALIMGKTRFYQKQKTQNTTNYYSRVKFPEYFPQGNWVMGLSDADMSRTRITLDISPWQKYRVSHNDYPDTVRMIAWMRLSMNELKG